MGNESVVTGLLAAIIAMAALAAPATAAHKGHTVSQPLKAPAAAQNRGPVINEPVLQAEVLLARAGFSPGTIDGRDGENFAKALHAFQQANGLPVGPLDQATSQRLAQLSSDPVLGQYTILPDDVGGPFVPAIPQDFAQMAQLPALSYRNPRQLLAEKFHMSEGLLAALNPGTNFAEAGAAISVANVAPMAQSPAADPAARQGSGSSGEPGAASPHTAAERVMVDKANHTVIVYGADNRLIAFYPASIGSAVDTDHARLGPAETYGLGRVGVWQHGRLYIGRGWLFHRPGAVQLPANDHPAQLALSVAISRAGRAARRRRTRARARSRRRRTELTQRECRRVPKPTRSGTR
jgi:peptidoglycan hydrolase-like protein with peptidoglycan-binding domain